MNRIFFHIQVSEGDLSLKKSEDAMSNDCSSDTKGIDYVAEDMIYSTYHKSPIFCFAQLLMQILVKF